MKIFCLVGPTGVGKTDIAIALAKKYNFDIISADSRQIYKYMDIGTAKPNETFFQDSTVRIRIHMLDIVTPDVLYSAADFVRDCKKIIYQLIKEEKKFILVGGSGLYLKALFEPFFPAPARDLQLRKSLNQQPLEKLYEQLKLVDPLSANRIKPNDRQRIIRALEIYYQTRKPLSAQQSIKLSSEFVPYYVGLIMERKKLYAKIEARFDKMIEMGLVEEVKKILQMGYNAEHNALSGIGYQEIISFLKNEISLMEAIKLAKIRTRQYAKRQITWFRKIKNIKWIEYTTFDETVFKVGQEYENYLKTLI
ncbi:MAG: tRNA (adenosine(37)-N6)-dimethylallyltransferase MiaA [candidate division WOR-3 bacterium]